MIRFQNAPRISTSPFTSALILYSVISCFGVSLAYIVAVRVHGRDRLKRVSLFLRKTDGHRFDGAKCRRKNLVLLTESLDVGFAVRIEEFLVTLLPCRFEFGRCDVPVRPASLEYCT
jgi:hypothetical protein